MKSGDDSEAESLAKAGLAREVNIRIREIAQSLTEPGDVSDELTFLCECGCFASVRLTLPAFEAAGGAQIEGHSRPSSPS